LEVEAAAAKGTCQQFKEQADRLREEMRVAAEKERAMFHEKRELIERLHVQGKVVEELERKIQELAVRA
jgi:DNA integrity scanning protein DisA with diadenylate cyclase activity